MTRSRRMPRIGRAAAVTVLLTVLAGLGVSAPRAGAVPAAGATTLMVAPTGTYHYRQTVPAANPAPMGTLVVAAASPGVQAWTRRFGTQAAVSISAVSYQGGGISTLAQIEQLSGSAITCTFAAPLPSPPWPLTAGAAFSGQAACTSAATLSVTGQVAGNVALSFNGQPVNTSVVGSTSVLAVNVLGVKYEVDVTEVDWFLPGFPVPLQSAIHVVIPSQASTTDSVYVLASFTQP